MKIPSLGLRGLERQNTMVAKAERGDDDSARRRALAAQHDVPTLGLRSLARQDTVVAKTESADSARRRAMLAAQERAATSASPGGGGGGGVGGGGGGPPGTPPTPTLNLAALPKRSSTVEAHDALDSSRRRAAAAAAAAARLEGPDGTRYADPETERFTYDEVRRDWRGKNVNPMCKELYLHDDEFERLFGMGKERFLGLKMWQQRERKQQFRLW